MSDKVKVLVVEDDQYLLTLFRFALTTRGTEFEIMTAYEADTALQLAREVKPDLVLLDILLPGDVDGIDVCRQIHSDPEMRGVGVVMVTACDDLPTRQAALEAGAADYWVKPISTRNLLDRVRGLLSLKPAAQTRAAARPIHVPPVQIGGAPKPGLDTALDSLRRAFSDLDPEDWAEIQALAEARAAYKQRQKQEADRSS
jgi:two-component system phosphate regulon response regulator PhoB